MSMLLFYVGENCYAIDCNDIVCIVPKVLLKSIPYAMNDVVGILNFRGKAVPVVDFCRVIEQRETKAFLNSRIILVKDPHPGSTRILGILGEKVEEMIDLQPEQFSKQEFPLHHFPYLDKVYSDQKGIIQYIHIEEFFTFLSAEIFEGKESHGF
jgi:chemotaxis-related protein WspB